ncbi:hypothetical protein HBI55_120950 [Parastagonospora nodorum]|nr:hypothetical protein HBI09_132460 [Parastagonospora nodorum]KAH4198098.1 hypothetical protein HBI95_184400 [Parastagonospora nodorum]KAH5001253.1 hypothetical protein HBI77_145510 [Parastagonospora nodorum]KAH5111917.1 hypothetical protein HBH71_166270 [Parastagonospora nodorum]KAH6011503.1 hypothetical protein HBI83_161340 [Parastagonospora nodorum]
MPSANFNELSRLNYSVRDPKHLIEKPYQIISEFSGEYKATNIDFSLSLEPEVINDIRGHQHEYGMDTHGFRVIENVSKIQDWSDHSAVEAQYLLEAKDLIAEHVENADEVHVFNWRRRKNKPYAEEGIQTIDLDNGSHYVLPANFVHLDQSPASALRLVLKHTGDRADDLLRGRVRIIK